MQLLRLSWDWSESHAPLIWWLFAASLVMLLATPMLVGWLVTRLPTDYFTPQRRQRLALWERHHVLRPAVLVAKNLAGIVLVVAGLVMLVTPGQGVLSIVLGIVLIDFPGKYRLERWLVTRPRVWRSINWLRERAGHEPFEGP